LQGKIAIFSGGATGMGGASSKLFAAEGARVAIVDRNETAAAAAVAAIREEGGDAAFWIADVSDEAAVIVAPRWPPSRGASASPKTSLARRYTWPATSQTLSPAPIFSSITDSPRFDPAKRGKIAPAPWSRGARGNPFPPTC
jgi:hypothetical protein